jgi:hypothetical protein
LYSFILLFLFKSERSERQATCGKTKTLPTATRPARQKNYIDTASRTTQYQLSNRTETVALLNKNGRINRDTLRAKTEISMPVFVNKIKGKLKGGKSEKGCLIFLSCFQILLAEKIF